MSNSGTSMIIYAAQINTTPDGRKIYAVIPGYKERPKEDLGDFYFHDAWHRHEDVIEIRVKITNSAFHGVDLIFEV